MKFKGIRFILWLFLIGFVVFQLSGCGSTGSADGDGNGDDGDDPTETVGTVTLSANPTSMLADGTSISTITASVENTDGTLISRSVEVTFSTTLGTLSTLSAKTENGVAKVSLTSGLTDGTAILKAASEGVAAEALNVEILPVPSSFTLTSSQNSVRSDDSDSSTITASLLDANRVPIEGMTVTFLATGGKISASSLETDEDGKAQIVFSAGDSKSNQTVSIKATVSGVGEKIIPIQVAGTTISLTTDKTSLDIEKEDTATLTVVLTDAGGSVVFDAPVTAEVEKGSGDLTLKLGDAADDDGVLTGVTNVNGEFVIGVTGKSVGDATVKVTALGDTKTQAYSVNSTAQTFAITEPAEDPAGMSIGEELRIVVRNPSKSPVQFSTTFGSWKEGAGAQVVTQAADADGFASATLLAGEAGVATVQVFDSGDATHTISDSLQVAISAPSDTASQIAIQASPSVVNLSVGDITNSSTITATVKNNNDQVVGNAPVAFSIEKTTGGGERISPVIVYTDSTGVATTTFFSGTLPSSANGVRINAVVLVGDQSVRDSVNIVIGGEPGSVTIGQSTEILESDDKTAYILPMSVQVVDANGNPVAGASVTLGAWPASYSTGYRAGDSPCVAIILETLPNEDENRNLVMDPGEDVNGDGELTPPSSSSGSVGPPAGDDTGDSSGGTSYVVTTGSDGIAGFNLTYLKTYADWIVDEITASTKVAGSETKSTYTFRLPASQDDIKNCVLPDSPFNRETLTGELVPTVDSDTVLANGRDTVDVSAFATDVSGAVVSDGTVVTFEILQGGGSFSGSPVFSSATVSGVATAPYTPPNGISGGTDVIIKVSSKGFADAQISLTLGLGSLLLSANPTSLVADGSAESTIIATLLDPSGNPVSQEVINFEIAEADRDKGGLPDAPTVSTQTATGTTGGGINGVASVTFKARTIPGTVNITATAPNIGVSETIPLSLAAEAAGSISLNAEPPSIPADGSSSSAITATIKGVSGSNMPSGTAVTFTTDKGTFLNGSQSHTVNITNDQGTATVSLVAANTPATAQVTCSVGGVSQVVTVEFTTGTTTQIGSISLSASPPSIPAIDGSATAVTATVLDIAGNAASTGTEVNFAVNDTTLGRVSPANPITVANSTGTVIVSLISEGKAGTIELSATAEDVSQKITVEFTSEGATLPAAFISLQGPADAIPADEATSTQITATITDSTGNAVSTGTPVTFSTTLGTFPNGDQTYSTATPDSSGTVKVALTAGNSAGTARVICTVSAGGEEISQSITVQFSEDTISKLPPAFIEVADDDDDGTADYPSPKSIGVSGSSNTSASTIAFEVYDSKGRPVDNGHRIDFRIVSGPGGGETLLTPFTTTADGKAETVLRTGTKSGAVQVKAYYAEDSGASTSTVQVDISGGMPVGDRFGISENGWDACTDVATCIAPAVNNIFVNLTDLYGNIVPDGTAVSMKTYDTGGVVQVSTAGTANGLIAGKLYYDPLTTSPVDGAISVTAEAVGGVSTHITALAVVSENSFNQLVYAGTDGGGVYKSTNSGNTWTNISRSTTLPGQNWIDPYVNDIVVDPRNSNIIYAATGFNDKGNIFRSLDGGQNWNSNKSGENNGIFDTDNAVLSMAIDDYQASVSSGPEPYVWIGTDGGGLKTLQFTDYHSTPTIAIIGEKALDTKYWEDSLLHYVNDIVLVPNRDQRGSSREQAVLYAATAIGVYRSKNSGETWSRVGDSPFTGYYITTLALHPSSTGGSNDVLYAGTRDSGIWISTNSGSNWVPFNIDDGKGVFATEPLPNIGNNGTGLMGDVAVFDSGKTENWTVTYQDDTSSPWFSVVGSTSGEQADYPATDIAAGTAYEIAGVLTFQITNGDKAFETGDTFTFSTFQEDGRHIKGLLIDDTHDRLYASTRFQADVMPHAVGNVYVHELQSDGSVGSGTWQEASTGLPEYSPPGDETFFAQHTLAALPDSSGEVGTLLVGGEGINLYRASSGLNTGTPQWQSSKSGLSNTIMARVPVAVPIPDNSVFYSGGASNGFVPPSFDCKGGRIEFTMSHDTSGAFSVILRDLTYGEGNVVLINSTTGTVEDEKTSVILLAGEYDLVVKAAGNWSVKVSGNIE
ncbi:hypothetical protein DENIS_4257 [Desulfonema ishimotonii]|uniref:Big-1 domain-containing protein n=1 Tax=Desulfonema ishimotonii TaxID=45657 RepID=A0A401G245_9BACT|nr:invasin domain 3-containing protein [Desulfonema ishimotonii]GBC63263.1 hypothetical protein DENIS_4257 [Desulfonema ishimotonii]